MPRFTTRMMLVACGIAALWFSSFGMAPGLDVRRSMLLLLLVVATSLALFRQGKQRVFWAGFAIVMLLCGGLETSQPLNRYIPDFAWRLSLGISRQAYPPYPYPQVTNPGTYVVPQAVPNGASGPLVYSYAPVPTLPSSSALSFWYAIGETIAAGWTLVLAALSGYAAVFVYGRKSPRVVVSPSAQRIVEEELGRQV